MKTRMKIWLDEPEEDNLGRLWCVDSLVNLAGAGSSNNLDGSDGRLLGLEKSKMDVENKDFIRGYRVARKKFEKYHKEMKKHIWKDAEKQTAKEIIKDIENEIDYEEGWLEYYKQKYLKEKQEK